MADDNGGIFDTTYPVLLFHPQLFEAKRFKDAKGRENGDPKFSGNLGFSADHPDLPSLKALALRVARPMMEKLGLKTSDLAFPFKNGTLLADNAKATNKNREFNRGLVIMPARSKFRPAFSAIINREVIEYDSEDMILTLKPKFFFGAEVLVKINLVAYEGVGSNKPGVNAYLNAVCATGKGKRISVGGAGSSENFRSYAGQMSAVDPTAGAGDDDEISF